MSLSFLTLVLYGCGGSSPSTGNKEGQVLPKGVYITVKADGGRTHGVGMRFNDAAVDLETSLSVAGTEDTTLHEMVYGSGTPIMRFRGYSETYQLLWTKDVQLTGENPEYVTIDPNGLSL